MKRIAVILAATLLAGCYFDRLTSKFGDMPELGHDDEDAIIIETGSDRVKMKFKKWCISSVDTVKEPKAQAATEEKKGLGGLFKRKKKEEAAEK